MWDWRESTPPSTQKMTYPDTGQLLANLAPQWMLPGVLTSLADRLWDRSVSRHVRQRLLDRGRQEYQTVGPRTRKERL
jgi:hypothetical protein